MESVVYLQARKYSDEGKRPLKCQDLDACNKVECMQVGDLA